MANIDNIAVADDGSMVVRVHTDRLATLVHADTWSIRAQFRVRWDSGGRRVAFGPSSDIFATGTFGSAGVAAYSVASDRELWVRADIDKVQHIISSNHQNCLVVVREKKPALYLDLESGETLRDFGVLKFFAASSCGSRWLTHGTDCRLIDASTSRSLHVVAVESFGILSACFSKDAVFVSEVGGPFRRFDLETGKERWRISRDGEHWTRIAVTPDGTALVGLCFSYQRGGYNHLRRIDAESAAVSKIQDDIVAGEFSADASKAYLYNGDVIDTLSGRLVRRDVDLITLPGASP